MTSDEAMFNRVMAGIERTENALRRMDAEPGGVSTPTRRTCSCSRNCESTGHR